MDKIDIPVLYVEDEITTQLTTATLLRHWAADVSVASNGQEGLALFTKHRPPIVITDIGMPLMDGLAMAREIKKIDDQTRIVVTTGHTESRYLMDAIEIGIDRYVPKPVQPQKMKAALLKCAREIQSEREREKLIQDLQNALAEVRQLSGLLPICASCKKIRDDHGYWNKLETYISAHSEADFTHTYCPECVQKILSDIEKRKTAKTDTPAPDANDPPQP